ncbi:hypothetical protein ACT6NV_06845 [Robiginitalea sp. IMCC44478]|uniref:hypothetical protein n=1 Tax=Robiginitalea sp. IMCC44478 TaxID=3459122 RepID=UPI004041F179
MESKNRFKQKSLLTHIKKGLKYSIFCSIVLLTACSNSDDCSGAKKFSPLTFSELTATSVVVSGYVVPKDCAELNYNFGSGVWYGTTPELDRTNGLDAWESLSLSFELLLENLEPGTKYYIRPYYSMNLGGDAGPIQEFTTLSTE